MDKKMSREEAEDTAIKRIVEVCKMCNTDKLTSTLYSYSGYLPGRRGAGGLP